MQGHPTTTKNCLVFNCFWFIGARDVCGHWSSTIKKLNKDQSIVYSLHGDGELQEGQNWEAILYAAAKKVDNLIATIDLNGKQIDGATDDVLHMGDLKAKFEAFDWTVIEIDAGNDIDAILEGMTAAKEASGKGKPVSVLHVRHGERRDFMCTMLV